MISLRSGRQDGTCEKDFWKVAGQIQIQLRPTREENNFINDFLSLLASSLINTDLAASAENACG